MKKGKTLEKILSALGDHLVLHKLFLFKELKFRLSNQAEYENIDVLVVRLFLRWQVNENLKVCYIVIVLKSMID